MIHLILLLFCIGVINAENSYITTVPKMIRPGSTAEIYVSSIKGGFGTRVITATLLDKEDKQLSSLTTNSTVSSGPDVVHLTIPDDIKETEEYKIRVKASGDIEFDKTAIKVGVLTKTSSIFIQTDKPLYKPGDLVQFRVFGTNSRLKVLDDPINIYIQDPKNNRIKQYLNETSEFGVFAGSFQLSTLTNTGNWKINVEQGREKNSETFSVESYVLPKFDVNVVMPSFQLKTDKYLTVTINAMYTFGKPVEGDVLLTLKRYYSEPPIAKIFKIKGRATVKFLMSDIFPEYGSYIEVYAEVKENITGNKVNDTKSIRIYETPEKLMLSPSMSSVFKPGLNYNIALLVTQQDDTPLKSLLGKVNITVTYAVPTPLDNEQQPPTKPPNTQVLPLRDNSYPPPVPEETKTLWSKLVQIPESGIIVLDAMFPPDAERGYIQASYRGNTDYKSIVRAESRSGNFIQIAIENNVRAKSGQSLPLVIQATENIQNANFKVFSKESLVSSGQIQMNNSSSARHNIDIKKDMAPEAKLLVYYTRTDGEIVADAIRFSVEDFFSNKVSLKFNKETVRPAEQVTLDIMAGPGSLVNILAVDKSILLLKTGNDITFEDVLSELQQYGNTRWYNLGYKSWDYWIPTPVSGKDAFSIFDDAGVYVLTDADLFQHRPPPRRSVAESNLLYSHIQDSPPAAYDFVSKSGGSDGGGLASPTRTRTNFPETWLWVNQTTGKDGRATITASAPDTITEWVTSAFAVSPSTGLGVATETANLTTFQRFFLRFDIPYQFPIIRGELLLLQISVFNYLEQEQQVEVKLENNGGIRFSDSNESLIKSETAGWTKSVSVKAGSVSSVFFPIIPTAVGKVLLRASARSALAADAAERELVVDAEGIKQSYNVPVLIDLRNNTSFDGTANLTFPPGLVTDSEFIKIQVIGDIMGPTLAGLDNLLQTSSGSGEQNMVNFVPSVFASSYLKATNRLTDELNTKIKATLEGGYQRELSFMHNDGSFSAFGSNDMSGSTWLTAFVLKSFAQAADHTFIDINVMTKSIQWLLRQQTPSGDFTEPGIVIHKEMQGGSTSNKKSLTAFVTIALQEAKKNDQVDLKIKQDVDSAIQKATAFIAEGAPASIANLYELVLVSYALHLLNHPSKDAVFTEVEKNAVSKGGEKYWKIPDTESDTIQPWKSWQPPSATVRALDIETTSYALLCYNLRGDTLNGIRVLKWLATQRNSNGGFISTQDTITALQGMAGLGEKMYVPNFNYNVNVKAPSWEGKTYQVNTDNAMVLQTDDAPKTVRDISVQANGNGLCLLEISVYFNVEQELRVPAFTLTPTVLMDSTKGFKLRVCFSWTKGEKSSMGYLEVSIPTGMEADLDTLDTSRAGGLFKKAEKAFRQVNLFFDSITSNEMCIEMAVNRVSLVARHKPVPIRLSEYNEPSNEVIKLYKSEALADATIAQICGPNNCEEVKRR